MLNITAFSVKPNLKEEKDLKLARAIQFQETESYAKLIKNESENKCYTNKCLITYLL